VYLPHRIADRRDMHGGTFASAQFHSVQSLPEIVAAAAPNHVENEA
jgi:hypothetical protein